MKRIVFDVAASEGGALTILEMYYNRALKEKDNQWIFVLSKHLLQSRENVKVLSYPWIKKSWFHRLFFDIFFAHRIAHKYKADKIISLQNIMIFRTRLKQEVYFHQTLIFSRKRYKIYENIRLWIIQNIFKYLIIYSIKKCDEVIVQTRWLKDECIKKTGVNEEKIKVCAPEVKVERTKKFNFLKSEVLFFYPANGYDYKNHEVIIKAVKKITQNTNKNFKIILTLNGDENKRVKRMYRTSKEDNLPIFFVGKITKEEVYEYYSKSILIFPSYIESFGLPLLEAKIHETPIIASDCSFSHEILDDYSNVEFFDPFNSDLLARIIEKFLLVGEV